MRLMEQTIGLALRCTNCRNRTGIDCARQSGDGAVWCPRCFRDRRELTCPDGKAVELVG